MKKVLIAVTIVTTVIFSASAQKLKPSEVPATVKSAFEKKFAGAKEVKWEKEDANYEVNFEQSNKEMSALFTSSGMLDEIEMEIKLAELPAQARTYLSTHYKGAKIKETAKITKSNGEVNYEAEVNKGEVIFDAKGKFLKVVKEAKD